MPMAIGSSPRTISTQVLRRWHRAPSIGQPPTDVTSSSASAEEASSGGPSDPMARRFQQPRGVSPNILRRANEPRYSGPCHQPQGRGSWRVAWGLLELLLRSVAPTDKLEVGHLGPHAAPAA